MRAMTAPAAASAAMRALERRLDLRREAGERNGRRHGQAQAAEARRDQGDRRLAGEDGVQASRSTARSGRAGRSNRGSATAARSPAAARAAPSACSRRCRRRRRGCGRSRRCRCPARHGPWRRPPRPRRPRSSRRRRGRSRGRTARADAVMRVHAEAGIGEFGHVGAAERDEAGLPQARHRGRVACCGRAVSPGRGNRPSSPRRRCRTDP